MSTVSRWSATAGQKNNAGMPNAECRNWAAVAMAEQHRTSAVIPRVRSTRGNLNNPSVGYADSSPKGELGKTSPAGEVAFAVGKRRRGCRGSNNPSVACGDSSPKGELETPQSASLTIACGRTGRGSDSPPDCHSLPRLRFAYPYRGAIGAINRNLGILSLG